MNYYFRFVFVFIILLGCSLSVTAQDFECRDKVYMPDYASVKFHINGLPTSEPIIDLGSGGQLLFSFDDLLGGSHDYTYSIIHCTKDWEPSQIQELDFLDGFNNERIEDYEYSKGTKYDYTHYELILPNDDTNWLISGNYLLVIRDDETEEVVITRRFMVTEQLVSIGADLKRSRKLGRLLKDQEIEISLDISRYQIRNPQSELFVTVLQNGRWDRMFSNLQPKFQLGSVLQFDRTQPLSFPAFHEFRNVDARTFLTRGFGVEYIDIKENDIDLYMFVDTKRDARINTGLFEDLNGDFVIEAQEGRVPGVTEEYVNLHFALYLEQEVRDGDLYVIGDFTDWEPKEEYRMSYDSQDNLYVTSALLKQGYYDYQYMIVRDNGEIDIEEIEGSYYATQNQYHILVYQRKFGELYDRLITVRSITTSF